MAPNGLNSNSLEQLALKGLNISCVGRNTDDTDVLYNEFNVDSSFPPDNPPQRPNSDYNCVVATTGQWKVARCTERRMAVCQSRQYILPG